MINPDSNGSQISKKIETPRTSVYMALEKLYSLGFIYLIPSLNERKNYMAADPDKLVMKLKRQMIFYVLLVMLQQIQTYWG